MWQLGIALSIVLTVCAWRYASAHPQHRAVAAFVTASLIADVVGRALIRLNAPVYAASHGSPFSGGARAIFHASEALMLVWPVGLAALAFTVLLERDLARRAVQVLGLVGLAILAGLVLTYPEIRGAGRAQMYLVTELSAVACAGAAGVLWWQRVEMPTLTEGSVLVFVALQVAAVVRWTPTDSWDWQRTVYAVAYAALVLLHVGELGSWKRSRSA